MKNNKYLFLFISIFVAALLLFLFAPFGIETSWARPGGGHSYSGGSGSSYSGGGGGYSGGGGGGDGLTDLIIFLIMALPPEISIPLVIIIFIVRFYNQRKKAKSGQSISFEI